MLLTGTVAQPAPVVKVKLTKFVVALTTSPAMGPRTESIVRGSADKNPSEAASTSFSSVDFTFLGHVAVVLLQWYNKIRK